MKLGSFCKQAKIWFYVAMLFCLLGLSVVPSNAAGATAPGSLECRPGSGWRWTSGPAQPDIAREAELALAAGGIESRIRAVAFGEQDSCGSFEHFSMDFSVSLIAPSHLSPEGEEKLGADILSVLTRFGTPQLGNVRIQFGESRAKFYPPPWNKAKPAADAASSPKALLNKKVYLLVYNPILSNGQDFNTYMGWEHYSSLVTGIIDSFQTASHGQLRYTVTYSHVVSDEWPIKLDGYRYTEDEYLTAYANGTPYEPGDVDYDAIIRDPLFDICGKFNRGEVDELWIYGGPYDGFYESRLVGPGGYWFNSSPMEQTHGCKKLLPIMGLNFERGVAEALHSFGHRAESTMVQVYGRWEQNSTANNWERFALVKGLSPNYAYSGCGNIHYPPNGVFDYDYGNPGTVKTNCGDFANYPNLNNPQTVSQSMTCSPWACDHLEYMRYWYSHLPSNPGYGPDTFANNWWLYFADVNRALTPRLPRPQLRYDFDRDGDTDVAIYRPSQGMWYVRNQFIRKWGIAGDIPVPGDYDGDGDTDVAIYRPSQGMWYVKDQFTRKWGTGGDIPVPGDYDGDGDTDLAIYRPSTGTWNVMNLFVVKYGKAGDIPLRGDFDGDRDTDLAVYRPSEGKWYVKNQFSTKYGIAGDIPLPGDYDGDGITDVAIYRPSQGMWYIQGQLITKYGIAGDIPVPADYDGDGDTDVAIYRPSQGMWYVRNQFITKWGIAGDLPIPVRDTNGDGDPYQ